LGKSKGEDHTENTPEVPPTGGNGSNQSIVDVSISQQMKDAYITYALSVIKSRALPDIRDGMKPVHRRIIYSMQEEGYRSDRRRVKSAAVVGDVNKKYHPHGDSAIYDTIVRLVQPFSMRYPLIDGQGNFGSVDGDPAAAQRYTEVRLSSLAEELCTDIDKNTVNYAPNYDESREEPEVLPARVPALLLNGAAGIAVGMATNIPPHNLSELVDAIIMLIENSKCTIDDIMTVLPGPDFPTGSTINGIKGIRQAYETGRGSIDVFANAIIEPMKNDRSRIVVTELPYQVKKAELIEKIANLVKDSQIEGIQDLRDESDRTGLRVVIDIKKEYNPTTILKNLFKRTALHSRFNVIMLALIGNEPQVFNIKEALEAYRDHRINVITRRSKFELKEAQSRKHKVEGLLKALDIIDEVIATIRASANVTEARTRLMEDFVFSQIQAQEILDMRLQRLTNLELTKLRAEMEELEQTINRLEEILGDSKEVLKIIKSDLLDLKKKYGDERKTVINPTELEIGQEELIPRTNVVISLTDTGYIKRIPVRTYKTQRRGGRGVRGMSTKDTDNVNKLAVTTTHHDLLFFTNLGRVFGLKAYRVPKYDRNARGMPVNNLISLGPEENVVGMLPLEISNVEGFIFMATKNGTVKKTALQEFTFIPSSGKIAIGLDDNDSLEWVRLTSGSDDVLLATRNGKSILFAETDVRPMGRTARGVRGIRLGRNDSVVGMVRAREGRDLLLVMESGFGKRTKFEEFNRQGRGGSGVICARVTKRTGPVCAIRAASPDDEILLISTHGIIIRSKIKDISVIGRATQGVKVMNLDKDDKVAACALILDEEGLEEGEEENGANGNVEEPDEMDESEVYEETEEDAEESD
jgi:DNA gyrase subunit A